MGLTFADVNRTADSEFGTPRAIARAELRLVRADSPTYDPSMAILILHEIKNYVNFTADDAAHLKAVGPAVRPHLGRVVDRFYEVLLKHPAARRAISGGASQIARLRGHLEHWLDTLFGGSYDESYVETRVAIGHTHVRIGLQQHLMFGALEIIRSELENLIRTYASRNIDATLGALHKLMAIETAIMLESYKESYSERLRRLERESMHERLTRAEHLAEIGQLAAVLAHELKNPLAGISGAIQVIRDELPPDNSHRSVLAEVLRQVGRLDQAVKDLLAYARPHPPRFSRCDLGAIVRRVLGLLAREPAFEEIRFEQDVDASAGSPECDEHQIEQVLLNLLQNAAQASPRGAVVRVRVQREAEALVITVVDQGCGMEPDVCERALDPFFTTKVRGTGLGLPICQGIIEAHHGTMSIESRTGEGTSVRVEIPLRHPQEPRP